MTHIPSWLSLLPITFPYCASLPTHLLVPIHLQLELRARAATHNKMRKRPVVATRRKLKYYSAIRRTSVCVCVRVCVCACVRACVRVCVCAVARPVRAYRCARAGYGVMSNIYAARDDPAAPASTCAFLIARLISSRGDDVMKKSINILHETRIRNDEAVKRLRGRNSGPRNSIPLKIVVNTETPDTERHDDDDRRAGPRAGAAPDPQSTNGRPHELYASHVIRPAPPEKEASRV
ncbi:hypothetical protein EVAR_47028_1 [Eumeta japonica]|uniref:Uncharacterized protein n=1 Tax=Eumeta variegata TaxID=151549 RepID=A0A4C1XF80_EUMVA|nr:hypothetical protein EVAR_47028_1 [Eumeta japonica]